MNKRRSTGFTPDHGDLARKFCMLGATDDELARLLEVARQTFDRWLAEVPEFAAAHLARPRGLVVPNALRPRIGVKPHRRLERGRGAPGEVLRVRFQTQSWRGSGSV